MDAIERCMESLNNAQKIAKELFRDSDAKLKQKMSEIERFAPKPGSEEFRFVDFSAPVQSGEFQLPYRAALKRIAELEKENTRLRQLIDKCEKLQALTGGGFWD